MENRILILKNLFMDKSGSKYRYRLLYIDLINWWWNFDEKFWTEICQRIKI